MSTRSTELINQFMNDTKEIGILHPYVTQNALGLACERLEELETLTEKQEVMLKSKAIVIEARDSEITRQSKKLLALGETLNEIAILVLSVWPKDTSLTYVDEAQGVRVIVEELERQRERNRELVEQCNSNYEPLRKQLEEQTLQQASVEHAYAVELDRLSARVCTRVCESDENGNIYTCSLCSNDWVFDQEPHESGYHYCPGCGAKIEKYEIKLKPWEEEE